MPFYHAHPALCLIAAFLSGYYICYCVKAEADRLKIRMDEVVWNFIKNMMLIGIFLSPPFIMWYVGLPVWIGMISAKGHDVTFWEIVVVLGGGSILLWSLILSLSKLWDKHLSQDAHFKREAKLTPEQRRDRFERGQENMRRAAAMEAQRVERLEANRRRKTPRLTLILGGMWVAFLAVPILVALFAHK